MVENVSQQKTIRKNWDNVSLEIEIDANKYNLGFSDITLEGCRAEIYVPDIINLTWQLLEDNDQSLILQSNSCFGKWHLKFSSVTNERGIGGVAIQLTGFVPPDCHSINMIPLSLDKTEVDHVLVHGRKMGGCQAYLLPEKEKTPFCSSFQHIITKNNTSVQFCHRIEQDHPSVISGTISGNAVENLQVITAAEFPAPGEIEAETVQIFSSDNGHDLMMAYGETHRNRQRVFTPQPAGWNSWDYYRWTITEEEVLTNAEFIHNDPVLSKHVKRIIVDDGWQYCYGEWEPNHYFGHGMKYLADELKAMGFAPGLWFAPTAIEPHARIAQWDTDMLALGEGDLPCLGFSCMKRYGMLLDPTVEKSRKWLFDLFSRYADMGYEYFKLDFLATTLRAKKFHQNHLPRARIMEEIVSPIREATRGKAQILGCNYNFEGGVDLVDMVRVSSDIHTLWNSVKHNMFSIAGRFWSNNKLWINDPDFAICRGQETSNDPDLQRLKCCYVFVEPDDPSPPPHCDMVLADINAEEAKTLMGLVVISGGTVNLSDKLTLLNDVGLDIVRRTVSATPGEAGVPIDLFTSASPSYWLQKIDNGFRVMLINWLDQPEEYSLDLTKHGINASKGRSFWTDEEVPVKDGKLVCELGPHNNAIVEFTTD